MQNLQQLHRLRDLKGQYSNQALWSLLVPIVLEQLLSVTIGVADTIMVSTAGDAAVSSISLVDSINTLLIQLFSALATGGAVVASQYLGAKNTLMARRSAKQLLYISLILSLLIMSICILLRTVILHALFGQAEAEVLNGCNQYFILSLFSYPALALYSVCTSLFRASNDAKTPLYCSLVLNIANLAGNALLIYVLKMGVIGAGLATLFSRVSGAVFMLCMLQRRSFPLRVERFLRPEMDSISMRILKIGLPSGLENCLFQVGKVLLSGLVSSLGTAAIAANAIGWSLASVICIPINAIGLGLLTIVGNCMGAKNPDGAQYYSLKLLKVTYLGTGILCLLTFLFIEPVSALFGLSAESRLLTCQIMRPYAIMTFLFAPPSFMLPNLLRGAGDVKYPMILSTLSMWIFRVASAFLLCRTFDLGLQGVWCAMYLDWAFRGALIFLRMLGGKWRRFSVI